MEGNPRQLHLSLVSAVSWAGGELVMGWSAAVASFVPSSSVPMTSSVSSAAKP
jgi:hypothetical protein